MTGLRDSNLSDIIARHRDQWFRRSMLLLANAVAAALLVGAFLGAMLMQWWRG